MAKKILIVEDEKPLSRAMQLKLTNSGFEAICAYNGQEALDIMEKEKVDLVFLDLVMPRMDGFATLEKLKEKKNKIPVIVLTNLSQGEDLANAKKLGAKDYFVKADTPISGVVEHARKILG